MEPFRKLISKSKILSWIVEKIATHTAIDDAHHVKYTDAMVDAIVATHTAIDDAHHSPYTDGAAIAAVLADDKYVKNTGDTMTGDLIVQNEDIIGENIQNTASGYPKWYSRKARGATTPILSGDTMGQFRFYGKNALGLWKYGGRLLFSVYGTIGNSYLDCKARLQLYHTAGYHYLDVFSTPWKIDLNDIIVKGIKRHNQSLEPTLEDEEMRFWRDSDNGKVYLIYKDVTSGQKKVELI